jgi:CheY-like chemotaxis protein
MMEAVWSAGQEHDDGAGSLLYPFSNLQGGVYCTYSGAWLRTGVLMNGFAEPVLVIGPELFVYGVTAALRAQGLHAVPLSMSERGDSFALAPEGPRPGALLIDLLVARRDDFALLRQVRETPALTDVPVIVSSSGTLGADRRTVEYRLRSLGTRPLLDPHDLADIVGELHRTLATVA